MNQMLLPILMFAALGAMMFFGMRKQKRQAAESKRMQESLLPGTRVMTTSGLYGTISSVADDTIELEVAPGVRTNWVRAAIREVVVEAPVVPDDISDAVDSTELSDLDGNGSGALSLDKGSKNVG